MSDVAPPASNTNRKAKRVAVAMASRIRPRGMAAIDVTIRDLAFTGFRADCEVALEAGTRVSIDLPTFGMVPARIAWCRDAMVGGVFDSAIDIRHCVLRPDEVSIFGGRKRTTARL